MAKETKILLISTAFILLVALIPNSYAELNLEDTSLLSNDGTLVIDFGKNVIKQQSSQIKTLPTLDFGIVRTINHDYFLDFSDDISVNVYGNSFVIKSFEAPPLLIYARNIGGSDYVLNVYTVDNGCKKQTFAATLESVFELEQEESSKSLGSKAIEELPEMKVLVKHTDRVYWQYSYFITVRVFDAELNQFNNFDQNWGYVSGTNILVEIFNEDDELLTSMSGKTGNTGFFESKYYVAAHLAPRGTYTVNVTADNGQDKVTKTLSMFVLGQAPRTDSSP